MTVLSTSTLVGDTVENPAGEKLGKLEEIMLDIDTGGVAYAVVGFGGFLGLGEKLFAVPWSALTLDTDNRRLLLDVDREMLKDAPGFDPDDWPSFADPDWVDSVHRHYDPHPHDDVGATFDGPRTSQDTAPLYDTPATGDPDPLT